MTFADNRNDLREDADKHDLSPDWHADVLRERLERETQGAAIWRSVDETFERIRAQIANGRFTLGESNGSAEEAAALQPRIL